MAHVVVQERVWPAGLARLEGMAGVRLTVLDPGATGQPLPAKCGDAQVLFAGRPPANLDQAKCLTLIQITSVGYEPWSGLGLPARGVRVANARGVFETAIAEWNVAMMINLARDLRGSVRNQEHGVWDRGARFQGELRGHTVGLWGYGGIGRETARLAKALGMTVHALARRPIGPRTGVYQLPGTGDPEGRLPDRAFAAGQEIEFLKGLDFLILAVPHTPRTGGMIGEEHLRALKPTAYLLNPARGPLIQEAALLRALREGWIAGAALDTHYYYPMPADHPLWRFPNVILTPHVSGADKAPHYLERIWDLFVQNVERHLAGQPLVNEVSADELNGT
jgi:phosphoglycerate dehydrogenase-like enzyme